ncbi:MAG: hypothetical protein EU542_01430 [Promethearchaeota archaeon]|nr:MAG: hypothetical protein EU542_01430 [Candidatus Lokiarchaeota archaeon]
MIKIKEDAKKMANLLKSGYTMLNLACPVCNNPLFRDKNGDTLCPICNRKVILVDNKSAPHKDEKKNIKNQEKKDQVKPSNNIIFQNLKQTAIAKLKEFTNLLENEKTLEKSEKIIQTLTLLANLINEVNKLI